MFHHPFNPNWNAGLFEGECSSGHFPGDYSLALPSEEITHCLSGFESFLSDHDAPEWSSPYSGLLDFEQQPQQSLTGPTTSCRIPTSTGFVLTVLTVEPQDTIRPPVIIDGIPSNFAAATSFTPYQATSAIQEAAEERQLGATESRAFATFNTSSLVSRKASR